METNLNNQEFRKHLELKLECKIIPLFLMNPYNPEIGRGIFNVLHNSIGVYIIELSVEQLDILFKVAPKDYITEYGFKHNQIVAVGKLTLDKLDVISNYIPYLSLKPIDDKGVNMSSYYDLRVRTISTDRTCLKFESPYSTIKAYTEYLNLQRKAIVLIDTNKK